MDSDSPEFRLGSTAITDVHSLTGRTLDQVYKNYKQGNIAYVFYNDQKPKSHRSYSSYGHSKGAFAFDEDSGFWLIHSVPKFPNRVKEGYRYPSSGLSFGQMMICVTFNSNQFENIAQQLIYNHPHIHDKFLPGGAIQKTHPNVKRLMKNKLIRRAPFSREATLQSSKGVIYHHFAKDNQWGKDLYRDFVAMRLNTSLLTETWQRGTDIGPSCSKKFHVEDIDKIDIVLANVQPSIHFKSINDHSKFAIGSSMGNPFVCVGDINRQPSQFKRGGGTLCFKNVGIWKQYYNFVEDIKGCPCPFNRIRM